LYQLAERKDDAMRVFLMLLAACSSLALTPVAQNGQTKASRVEAAPVHAYFPKDMASCGQWVAERKQGSNGADTAAANMARAWMWGFVTGVGAGGRELRGTDGYSIDAWTDKYCGDHPLDTLTMAALKLVDELSVPTKEGR
jgi:hypothetical protein